MEGYTPKTPKDFCKFMALVWDFLNLPEPTPVQLSIGNYIQCGPRRLIIEAFRGVGKSWITAAFVCWLLDQHPDWRILVVSASKERADNFTTFVMLLIRNMPLLKHLIPMDNQRNSKLSFDVAPAPPDQAPSLKSAGINGQITGSRADVIIADDIEVPNNSATQGMRDKLSEQVKEFDAILKPGATSRVIFLGTPQNEQTIYNKLVNRGYEMRVWPAEVPAEDDARYYKGRLAPMVQKMLGTIKSGTPIDPKRFDSLDLAERKTSYGKAGYSLQFMLNTHLSDLDKYPLKVADLIMMSLDMKKAPDSLAWCNEPEKKLETIPNVAMEGDHFYRPLFMPEKAYDYQGAVLAIDPSGRGKDELGYCVMKMQSGQLFVPVCSGLRGGYAEHNLIKLAQVAKLHNVSCVLIEENFGDGMFTALFKPIVAKYHAVSIEEVKHSKQKELRICDTLEPIMNQHKLILDPKVVEEDYASVEKYGTEEATQYTLIYQMTRITREKGALAHDDRIDVLAMAAAYWVEMMGRGEEELKKDRDEEALQKMLDDFEEHVMGRSRPSANWFVKVAR